MKPTKQKPQKSYTTLEMLDAIIAHVKHLDIPKDMVNYAEMEVKRYSVIITLKEMAETMEQYESFPF